ncbi:MAG: hypothetical protein Q7S87_18095 [Agitococcus sp.]|nr:hypothetical protein [Agitococcus sp.]
MHDVVIWFEDCTRIPHRACNESGVASRGMQESALASLLQQVSVTEKRYVEPGLLSAIRLCYPADLIPEDFEKELKCLAQEMGTNPWIRNAGEPDYLAFWNSRKLLF